MRAGSIILLLLAACAEPLRVKETLDRTAQTIAEAHAVYASLCAPEALANAQSHLDFTRIELHQGYLERASEHIDIAYAAAVEALEVATPCGGVDTDGDTIPNIVDACPEEPEDFDGEDDEDGCRDLDPHADDDGDEIINIDDACVDQAEDFDGDNDEDGCPETSDDSDGDGIITALDTCPSVAEDFDGFKDSDGCPDLDNDGDGIADLRDRCALIAEDLDGWDDEDGCPDPDNDSDGIPDVHDNCKNQPGIRENAGCPEEDADKDGISDATDRCPDQPETRNNYLDDDGCPDTPPEGVKVTRTRVEINDTIQFQTGSANLMGASNTLLDSVVQVLVDAPYIRLRVEGHTDSEGTEPANLRLSNARAQAVRAYLAANGVAADRLVAVGFGETRPIDTNRTVRGRALNRRVEFHIVRDEGDR